ncbi:hypothetical protein [Bradyrhizobium sp.]|uniref:hypothetical protein n=1 Tax=Bradyrhizobium sp. TaxID=376 RepID=UPI0025BE9270|nr:hypothetical protein [Bradyrhizobium sp.]
MLLDNFGIAEIVVDRDAGIVDEDVEASDRAGCARNLSRIGDIKHQRRHTLVGMLELAARSRLNLACSTPNRVINERPPDAVVSASDQNTLICDIHSGLL